MTDVTRLRWLLADEHDFGAGGAFPEDGLGAGLPERLSRQSTARPAYPFTPRPFVMATVHPSSILRAPDEEKRRQVREDFIADITKVAEVITTSASPAR